MYYTYLVPKTSYPAIDDAKKIIGEIHVTYGKADGSMPSPNGDGWIVFTWQQIDPRTCAEFKIEEYK
jgi:hypothetical protein